MLFMCQKILINSTAGKTFDLRLRSNNFDFDFIEVNYEVRFTEATNVS